MNNIPILSVYDAQGNKITIPAIKGERGKPGSDASVTAENIQAALGFVPGNEHYYSNISTCSGKDLSQYFTDADALHAAVTAGDFSKINIGDYWPITLNGSYYDYADSETKTVNATVHMEVAAINPYLRHGDTEFEKHHILFCSRDCLPNAMKMRSDNITWYNTDAVNPWLGSALYETLNNSNNGVIKLVENSALGSHIFKGPNGKGMRARLETMASGAASPTGSTWSDRGLLFLPTEREVFGSAALQTNLYSAGNLYNQWPIFRGSARHIIKSSGAGGARTGWWLETPIYATAFTFIALNGFTYFEGAGGGYLRVPLCFLFI